jgi:ribonuclease HI
MHLRIYTDGGCSGNPGPGGWAYVIIAFNGAGIDQVLSPLPGMLFPPEPPQGKLIRENWGGERVTTNNRMELLAAVFALESLVNLDFSPESVTVYTDSQYVQKGMTTWINSWKRNGWRTSERKPVKNQELWLRLDELGEKFEVVWRWVRGHAGNEFNERCDQMTQKAIADLSKKR